MERPLISIITVVYNASSTLEKTILSVIKQKTNLIEFLIIDGGSTDGSLDIIKKYGNDITHWISEPDKGIYDAMNKGISQSTGGWIYFLGADDVLKEGILTKISTQLDPNLAVVFGNVIYDTGHTMRSRLGYRIFLENTLHHQGAFYNRNLFSNFKYNTQCRVSSDYELNLRIALQKLPFLYFPHIIAICGSTGVSSVTSSKETNHLRGKYIKNPVLNNLLSIILNIYYFYFNEKLKLKRLLFKLL